MKRYIQIFIWAAVLTVVLSVTVTSAMAENAICTTDSDCAEKWDGFIPETCDNKDCEILYLIARNISNQCGGSEATVECIRKGIVAYQEEDKFWAEHNTYKEIDADNMEGLND